MLNFRILLYSVQFGTFRTFLRPECQKHWRSQDRIFGVCVHKWDQRGGKRAKQEGIMRVAKGVYA